VASGSTPSRRAEDKGEGGGREAAMQNVIALFMALLSTAFLAASQTHAGEENHIKIENSLPQSKLAYYNDTFGEWREDVWETAALTWTQEQLANYKMADIRIEHEQLIVTTKTGGFSQRGLGSKYVLRGDFDIQLDCHVDFLKEKQDCDHYVFFFVTLRETKGKGQKSVANVGLFKKSGHRRGIISCRQRIRGEKFPLSKGPRIGKFHGSFRIVRMGDRMSMLYKKDDEGLWRELSNFTFPLDDVRLGFSLQNFILQRDSIRADESVSAKFDNFKINAAQEIIEEEI